MAGKAFPFEIRDVEPEAAKMLKHFTGEYGGFIHVGPKGYILTKKYEEMAADIYNMEIRPDDVFVVTYARSGTTWTQELVWLVANNLDYETAKSILLTDRFPFIEFSMMIHHNMKKEFLEKNKGNVEKLKLTEIISSPVIKQLTAAPSPRFIKSHLPLSLLPPNIYDAKVVYVARDPRDVVVSFYNLCKSMIFMGWDGDLKTFWNLFIKDLIYWVPFFDHLKEAWEKRNDPNVLFLFYEELQQDLPAVVNRVANFLGKTYTEAQIAGLCEHLHVSNFKKNPSVNSQQLQDLGFMYDDHEFIRKGKSGGWREHFDEEMTAQAEQWITENLKDTDLRFPHLI